jgi:hypothetical protein
LHAANESAGTNTVPPPAPAIACRR